ATRPHAAAGAHQLTHDGAADSTGGAENDVQRTARFGHCDPPYPGTQRPAPNIHELFHQHAPQGTTCRSKREIRAPAWLVAVSERSTSWAAGSSGGQGVDGVIEVGTPPGLGCG